MTNLSRRERAIKRVFAGQENGSMASGIILSAISHRAFDAYEAELRADLDEIVEDVFAFVQGREVTRANVRQGIEAALELGG